MQKNSRPGACHAILVYHLITRPNIKNDAATLGGKKVFVIVQHSQKIKT